MPFYMLKTWWAPVPQRRWRLRALAVLCGILGLAQSPATARGPRMPLGTHVVFAYNDLGTHCMNSDFSEIMVLPPFNTVHAQVIRRGVEPEIVTGDVTVRYVIPSNTHSADKSNFWKYPQPIFGPAPLPNIGLAGFGLAGTMPVTASGEWVATGIPITPTDDTGR